MPLAGLGQGLRVKERSRLRKRGQAKPQVRVERLRGSPRRPARREGSRCHCRWNRLTLQDATCDRASRLSPCRNAKVKGQADLAGPLQL